MLQRSLIHTAIVLTAMYSSVLFSKDIPSGNYVKGKLLEKGESFVSILVSEPPFCVGIQKFLVKEGIFIPPEGTTVKAQLVKGKFCDDEEPVIERFEGTKDEKD